MRNSRIYYFVGDLTATTNDLSRCWRYGVESKDDRARRIERLKAALAKLKNANS